jgi:BASS family bile acid:Na+ symporter
LQDTLFTQVLLPAILGVIMFGMGLSLVKDDFVRLAKVPKSIIAGLTGQLILLPLLAFALVTAFSAPIEIAIGVMILAACPGGTTSNLISHIARANLALSVSLTAITTVICVITTPLLIKFSIDHFSQTDATEFSLIGVSINLIVLLLVPISIGMVLRHFYSKAARRAEPFFKHFSTLFMLVLIAVISYQEREMLQASFPDIFFITFSLNICATIMGVIIARACSLSKKDGLTLGIEIGTQNASMAMLIAITFIENSAFSIAAGIYGITMYVGAFLLVAYHKLTSPASA